MFYARATASSSTYEPSDSDSEASRTYFIFPGTSRRPQAWRKRELRFTGTADQIAESRLEIRRNAVSLKRVANPSSSLLEANALTSNRQRLSLAIPPATPEMPNPAEVAGLNS
jgi:hypothetical protein